MIISEITREYSRSINTGNYGAAESWIKVSATYTGKVESGDDAKEVSEALGLRAMNDVVAQINILEAKIRNTISGGSTAGVSSTVPPVYPPTATPQPPMVVSPNTTEPRPL